MPVADDRGHQGFHRCLNLEGLRCGHEEGMFQLSVSEKGFVGENE